MNELITNTQGILANSSELLKMLRANVSTIGDFKHAKTLGLEFNATIINSQPNEIWLITYHPSDQNKPINPSWASKPTNAFYPVAFNRCGVKLVVLGYGSACKCDDITNVADVEIFKIGVNKDVL